MAHPDNEHFLGCCPENSPTNERFLGVSLENLLSEVACDALDALFGGGDDPSVWAGARLTCRLLRSLVDQHTVRKKVPVQLGPEVGAWRISPLHKTLGRRCQWLEVVPGACPPCDKEGGGVPERCDTSPVERLDMRLSNVQVETVAQLACSMGLPNVRHLNLGACCQWAQTTMSALYPEMAAAMPHLQSIEVPLTSCVRGLEALAGLTSVRAVPTNVHLGTPLLIADARSLVQLPNLQRLELCLSAYGPRHRLQQDEWQHGGLARPEDAAALSGAADPCIKEQLYALRMLAASAPKKLERISIVVLSMDAHCTMYDAHITLQEGRVCSVALGNIQGTLRTANYLAAALLPVVAAYPTGRLRSLSADSLYNMCLSCNTRWAYAMYVQETSPSSPLSRLVAACDSVAELPTLRIPEPFEGGALLPDSGAAILNMCRLFRSFPGYTQIFLHDRTWDTQMRIFDRDRTLCAPEGLLGRALRWVQARMATFLVDTMLFASAALTDRPLAPWARARMPRPCETLQGFWDGFHQVPRSLEEKVAFFLKLARLHRVLEPPPRTDI